MFCIFLVKLLLQKDFLDPKSVLFVPGGPAVIPAVQKAVDIARQKGAFVVWVRVLLLLLKPLTFII